MVKVQRIVKGYFYMGLSFNGGIERLLLTIGVQIRLVLSLKLSYGFASSQIQFALILIQPNWAKLSLIQTPVGT